MQRAHSLLVAGAAALALAAPAAALDVDLVVQMPLAVVEVEDAGYPRDDLALLTSGLIAADLEPVEVIDVLRWAPVVWLLDELEDDALFVDTDLDLAPGVRRLRLIEDRDGRFLVTTREDLVFVDLADPVVVERQFLVDRDRDVIFDDRVRDRDVVRERDVVVVDRDVDRLDRRGMGAYVQFLHEQGLRGRELADAIHAELDRRGVPAGPKDRLDGPPPVSRRFVVAQAPERVIVDGREVVLLDRDVDVVEMRFVPPSEVRRRLAEAPSFDRAERIAAIGRPDDDERRGRGRTGPPADRGPDRGRGSAERDDRGGGPPDHAANRGRGGDDRGGPKADRGNSGRGGGNAPKADRDNSGRGGGGPKADRGNSGGGGQGKGKGNSGGGNRGQGGGGKGKGRG